MENLIFALNGILPIFAIVLFGFFLRKKNIINEEFCSVCSKLVFVAALPAMLFMDVAATEIENIVNVNTIIFAVVVLVLLFFILQIASNLFISEKKSRGAFIQGVMRTNYAIFGLPIAYNLFGQEGITKGAILLAFVIPLNNVLAVIALTLNSPKHMKVDIIKILRDIIKNPFIIAIALAIPFSVFKLTIPGIVTNTISYVSSLAIPLALIGLGGSFSFLGLKKNINLSLVATFLRNILIPVLVTFGMVYFGFRGADAGILFILFAAPTAISSYVMAKAMGSDAEMTSNIILMSTLGSVVTITLGFFWLKSAGIV